MSIRNQIERLDQAMREVGWTEVTRSTAIAMAVCLVLLIAVPPVLELAANLSGGRPALAAAGELAGGFEAGARSLVEAGPLAANRALLSAIETAEDRLEEDSLLRRRLLPPVQRLLTSTVGLGNEQTYIGSDGWLFFRPDVDYSIGRAFLDPDELRRRRRSVDSAIDLQPDPVRALEHFAAQLEGRGIRLLVVPVPGKPVIYPTKLTPRRRFVHGAKIYTGLIQPPAHNPSFLSFVRRLRAAGIAVYDPSVELVELWLSGVESFLRTDSHWTPPAMEAVGAAISRQIEELVVLEGATARYVGRPVQVTGRGDLEVMLRLADGNPLFAEERVETRRVLTGEGRSWRRASSAEVLLLGDSFTNVFSDPSLGWGAGAGLAEQLSFELERPVDRIARNAGGAYHAREELARELAAGRDRLAATKIVVYEFATRELTSGDWRLVDLD